MGDLENAIQRLMEWLRDCGSVKSTAFQDDLSVVLRAARNYVQQRAEIERLRKFARRIYDHEYCPAWAHDAAAKVLAQPSLCHGCDDTRATGGE